jgi:hypothetical protein
VLALARPAQLFFVRSSQFERACALRNRGSKMRLIVDALIMIALGLFAWLVAFLGFAVLYAGPHGPRPKTLAVVAMVPAILVNVGCRHRRLSSIFAAHLRKIRQVQPKRKKYSLFASSSRRNRDLFRS